MLVVCRLCGIRYLGNLIGRQTKQMDNEGRNKSTLQFRNEDVRKSYEDYF